MLVCAAAWCRPLGTALACIALEGAGAFPFAIVVERHWRSTCQASWTAIRHTSFPRLPPPQTVQVSRLISSMVQAVERAAAKVPLCAVIHTTLPPANQAPGRSSSPSSGAGAAPGVEPVQLAPTAAQLPGLGGLPPYFLLRQAVPHELLLPQVDLAVHHGGAGTTQAVLLAGRRGR